MMNNELKTDIDFEATSNEIFSMQVGIYKFDRLTNL
jgi:hypothetical protein